MLFFGVGFRLQSYLVASLYLAISLRYPGCREAVCCLLLLDPLDNSPPFASS